MIDPYIDPQSGVLRNRFGLADQQSLDRAEANAVSIRSILLQAQSPEGEFRFRAPKGDPFVSFSRRVRLGAAIPDDPAGKS